jgi:hypothetical protein
MGSNENISLQMLQNINWERMSEDVSTRIKFLGMTTKSLAPDHPLSHQIASDLIVPAIDALYQFCQIVSVEEEPDASNN